jgi:aspartyl-tRNA(Asn)/glutamyl-tRNA(Gln) amidotransferase subunit B
MKTDIKIDKKDFEILFGESDFIVKNGCEFIDEFEIICGLEIHAQVLSETKLFSRAPNSFGNNPNTSVALLDMAFPGVLPLLNEKCVEQGVKTGLGLNCHINNFSFFERKHYFYPDLPAGYQISQLKSPIAVNGSLKLNVHGIEKTVRINRIQLEQDAGKSVHDISDTESFIDLNRAGIPLMEIVSEPDIRSIEEAIAYVSKIRSILQCLNTSTAKMEEGELRVDANVSIRRPGEGFGNRVEIKNVNSLKFLEKAMRYECVRQASVVKSGGAVDQETRLFDSKNGITITMRAKEDALDYRYFRDPDLFPLRISDEYVAKIKNELPELPDQKFSRIERDFGIAKNKIEIIVSSPGICNFFDQCVKISVHGKGGAESIANWIVGDLSALVNSDENEISFAKLPFSPEYFTKMVDMIIDGKISNKSAKDVLNTMWESGKNPLEIVKELGLEQVSDTGEILTVIQEVLQENPNEVQGYLDGKDKLITFFVGQIMKKSKGRFNPAMINDILIAELENLRK